MEGDKLSALGRLIASLSHEINNPINVLRNNLEPLGDYFGQMSEVLGVVRAGGDLVKAWTENDIDFVLQDGTEAVGTMSQGITRIQAIHNEMRAFVRGDAPEMQAVGTRACSSTWAAPMRTCGRRSSGRTATFSEPRLSLRGGQGSGP